MHKHLIIKENVSSLFWRKRYPDNTRDRIISIDWSSVSQRYKRSKSHKLFGTTD